MPKNFLVIRNATQLYYDPQGLHIKGRKPATTSSKPKTTGHPDKSQFDRGAQYSREARRAVTTPSVSEMTGAWGRADRRAKQNTSRLLGALGYSKAISGVYFNNKTANIGAAIDILNIESSAHGEYLIGLHKGLLEHDASGEASAELFKGVAAMHNSKLLSQLLEVYYTGRPDMGSAQLDLLSAALGALNASTNPQDSSNALKCFKLVLNKSDELGIDTAASWRASEEADTLMNRLQEYHPGDLLDTLTKLTDIKSPR